MEEKGAFDSKTIIALVVCLGFWFAWQKHLESKYPHMNAANKVQPENKATASNTQSGPQTDTTAEPATGAASTEIKKLPTQLPTKAVARVERTYENSLWKVSFDSLGGSITKVVVKDFRGGKGKEDVVVFGAEPNETALNVVLEGKRKIDFSQVNFAIKEQDKSEWSFAGEVDGTVLKKTFIFDTNARKIKTYIEVSGKTEGVENISIFTARKIPNKSSGGSFLSFAPPSQESYQEYFFKYKNKTERDTITHDETPSKKIEQAFVSSIGDRYFTTVFLNKSNVVPNAETLREGTASILKTSYPVLETGGAIKVAFDFYSGPKSVPELKAIDPFLSDVVDFGMFSVIALPLLAVMKWFHSIIGNYGVAIILLTILVRFITFPFTYMSYKSMKAMQKIQPQVAQLKERYKGNNQAFNLEVMKLYKENKVNPMGGCLPMLLQLPVFWALYQVLQNSIELYKTPFFLWIHDLSQKDPYYVLPVLMGISMFVQQKMTPTTMDPAQAKVMLFMPIFFAFLMLSLPSGLTLYIFVSTLFGIIQQMIMMKDKPSQAAPVPAN